MRFWRKTNMTNLVKLEITNPSKGVPTCLVLAVYFIEYLSEEAFEFSARV